MNGINATKSSFWGITLRTTVAHTVTYFAVGLIAYTLFNYSARFTDPALSSFMRQTNDPLVAAGPLFQPIRGVLFGLVFYLLQDIFFRQKNGWLILWISLVVMGILSTFGPTPGSIEGFIYTNLPLKVQLPGLTEVLSQSFLFSIITYYWVNHSKTKWLNWVLGILFFAALILPALGLLARQVLS